MPPGRCSFHRWISFSTAGHIRAVFYNAPDVQCPKWRRHGFSLFARIVAGIRAGASGQWHIFDTPTAASIMANSAKLDGSGTYSGVNLPRPQSYRGITFPTTAHMRSSGRNLRDLADCLGNDGIAVRPVCKPGSDRQDGLGRARIAIHLAEQ
jgi:hypothetical protein